MHDPLEEAISPTQGEIKTLVKTVGKKKPGQCIWGFINGISNTKAKAASSAELISSATGGEEVLYLPNDSWFPLDAPHCVILKLSIDTPIVLLAEKFFRYLLTLSTHNQPGRPRKIKSLKRNMNEKVHRTAIKSLQKPRDYTTFTPKSFHLYSKQH